MQKVSNSCRIIYSQIGNKDKNEIQIFGSQFTSIFKIIIPAYQLIRERQIPTELLKIWRMKTENVGDDKVLKGAAKYFTSNDHSMNDTLNQYYAEWKITSNRGG